MDNQITVILDGGDEPPDLTGKFVYIDHDGVRNASYEIYGSAVDLDGYLVLNLGSSTPIRSWADANDFSRGYNYDFAEGASLRIPLSWEWKVDSTRDHVYKGWGI